MARHTGKRKKWHRVEFSESFALGTLADGAAAVSNLTGGSASDNFYATSVEASWSMEALTAGEVPIVVGLAHSDYSAAEVEAWIENTASFSQDDLVAQEVSRRKIRNVGQFSDTDETDLVLNEGNKFKTICKFLVNEGKTINAWAYNKSGSALMTGAVINIQGEIIGYWID